MSYLARYFLDAMFSKITEPPFEVQYWNGVTETYGSGGSPSFSIRFEEPVSPLGLITQPSVTLGEAYMEGTLHMDDSLPEALRLFLSNREELESSKLLEVFRSALRSGVSIRQQREDVQHHYDLGNDFYRLWLDETMTYSCAYFRSEENSLKQAQQQKIDHGLRKLDLNPGERLLDIGSGWGSTILRAARNYDVEVMGITLSEEQVETTRQRIEERELEERAEVRIQDYRELADSGEQFDKIISIGMAEHVGQSNLPVYYNSVKRLLKPGGRALIHHITKKQPGPINHWIRKYIFPGAYLPTLVESIRELARRDFHVQDVEGIGRHYAWTLDRWAERFEKNQDTVRKMFDERFVRMWRLYLRSCAELFRGGYTSVHQILAGHGAKNKWPITREYMYSRPDSIPPSRSRDSSAPEPASTHPAGEQTTA